MPNLIEDTETVAKAEDRRLARLRRLAVETPWNGQTEIPRQQRIRAASHLDRDIGVSLLLTYDIGYHASGWWRNSQYDSCWHASLVCINLPDRSYTDPADRVVRAWMHALFREWLHHAWTEPPATSSDPYRNAPASRYTTHVRIFTDRSPIRPITPKGEVYDLLPWDDGSSPDKVFRT